MFLEMLARQAASVELALQPSGDRTGAIAPDVMSRILVGTIGEPRSEAYSAAIGDTAVIAMSAGMMEFYYQCAKAVVLAWKPLPPDGVNLLSFSSDPADTEESLDGDPPATRRFPSAWPCSSTSTGSITRTRTRTRPMPTSWACGSGPDP